MRQRVVVRRLENQPYAAAETRPGRGTPLSPCPASARGPRRCPARSAPSGRPGSTGTGPGSPPPRSSPAAAGASCARASAISRRRADSGSSPVVQLAGHVLHHLGELVHQLQVADSAPSRPATAPRRSVGPAREGCVGPGRSDRSARRTPRRRRRWRWRKGLSRTTARPSSAASCSVCSFDPRPAGPLQHCIGRVAVVRPQRRDRRVRRVPAISCSTWAARIRGRRSGALGATVATSSAIAAADHRVEPASRSPDLDPEAA